MTDEIPGGGAVRETLQEILRTARERAAVDAGPVDPSGSALHGRLVVVTGPPRSGTTWVHQMLAAHPDVATGGESHLFCEGVAALIANFDDPDPYMKLSTWVSRPELVRHIRRLADGIFTTAIEVQRPAATRVLDKTPNHAMHAGLLGEVYPDAAYIHVVRHARDSLASAHDLWAEWDPQTADWTAAAERWRDSVLDSRTHLASLRYLEIRYEDLLADPITGLAAMFDVAGLTYDDELLRDVVRFGQAPLNVRPSLPTIEVAKWAGFDPAAERRIAAVAGDLLAELGYDDGEWVERAHEPGARSPVRSAMRDRFGMRLRRRAIATSAVTRRVGEELARRGAGGDDLVDLLAAGVTLDAGVDQVSGAADVAAWLHRALAGARVVGVDADARAAGVQVVLADSRRQLHRYFVAGDRVEAVVVQGE